jgi:hypothetical protein
MKHSLHCAVFDTCGDWSRGTSLYAPIAASVVVMPGVQ